MGVRGDGNMEGGCRSALRKGEGIGEGGKEGDYFLFLVFSSFLIKTFLQCHEHVTVS